MTPDARRPRSGSNDQGQPSQDAGADVKATSTLPPAADTATPTRHERLALPHRLYAWLEPRDAAVDRYARELVDEGWDKAEARAAARQYVADQRTAAAS